MEILKVVQDAIQENPEITNDQLVEKLRASDSDVLFTTKTENETHIANQVNNSVQNEVNNAIRNVHTKNEEAMTRLTGITKPDGVKGYEWTESLVSDQLNTIKGLNEKVDANLSGDEVAKQQVLELREQLLLKEGELTQKGLDNVLFQKDNHLSAVFAGLDLDKNLDPDLIALMVTNLKKDLINKSELKDGKLIFKNEDGTTRLNAAKGSEPYTAAEIVGELMQKYTAKDVVVTGLNGVPVSGAATTADPVSNFIASKAPKTSGDVYEAATEYYEGKGISNVSPIYIKAVTEANTKYKFE